MAVQVHNHQVVRFHHALGYRSGRTKHQIMGEPHGDVPIRSCHIAVPMKHLAKAANLLADTALVLSSHFSLCVLGALVNYTAVCLEIVGGSCTKYNLKSAHFRL